MAQWINFSLASLIVLSSNEQKASCWSVHSEQLRNARVTHTEYLIWEPFSCKDLSDQQLLRIECAYIIDHKREPQHLKKCENKAGTYIECMKNGTRLISILACLQYADFLKPGSDLLAYKHKPQDHNVLLGLYSYRWISSDRRHTCLCIMLTWLQITLHINTIRNIFECSY